MGEKSLSAIKYIDATSCSGIPYTRGLGSWEGVLGSLRTWWVDTHATRYGHED